MQQHVAEGLGGGGQLVLAQPQQADPSLHLRRVERQAARAEFLHLLDAQGRHGADTESLGDHPPDRDQLVALERHLQATVLGGHAFFQEQAHRRGRRNCGLGRSSSRQLIRSCPDSGEPVGTTATKRSL